GTGLHPTTRMCLELLERLVRTGVRVLDLGTGSGVLAIAAAKLGASQVLALDTDSVAVRVADDNVSLNRVGGRVQVQRGTLTGSQDTASDKYDVISANITAKTICDLAPAMVGRLRTEGIIIAGGILEQQLDEVEGSFAKLGCQVRETVVVEDWRTVVVELKRS
ncbi:MAG: 50S ribosomal protein L11 methyltransferase, partial [Dehalococcoidia bacterium]